MGEGIEPGDDRSPSPSEGPLGGFDVGGLSPVQRVVLSRVLDEAGIYHDFVGPELQAPGAHAELVEMLVARAARATGEDDHDRELFADVVLVEDESAPDEYGLPIASRVGRFLAYLLEAVLASITIMVLQSIDEAVGRSVGLALSVGSGLLLVAVMGGTIGMLLYGLRVVAVGQTWVVPVLPLAPGWSVATVRFLVVAWPGLLAHLLWFAGLGEPGWIGRLAAIWSLLCFAPILWDPMRRGLHDRVARTLVVDVRGLADAAEAAREAQGH